MSENTPSLEQRFAERIADVIWDEDMRSGHAVRKQAVLAELRDFRKAVLQECIALMEQNSADNKVAGATIRANTFNDAARQLRQLARLAE